MIRKTIIALVFLALVSSTICNNAHAVEELMDIVSDPSHIDHHAGMTEHDVLQAHQDTEDEIGIRNIHKELKDIKKRIKSFNTNPEQLTNEQKDQLIARAKHIEELRDSHENWHEELNAVMAQLAALKVGGEETDL
jgi:peptidoglycan hydrolase CwlO-like protein